MQLILTEGSNGNILIGAITQFGFLPILIFSDLHSFARFTENCYELIQREFKGGTPELSPGIVEYIKGIESIDKIN